MPELTPRHRDHPDHDAVWAAALRYLLQVGKIRNDDLDRALASGESMVRAERVRAEKGRT